MEDNLERCMHLRIHTGYLMILARLRVLQTQQMLHVKAHGYVKIAKVLLVLQMAVRLELLNKYMPRPKEKSQELPI